MVMPIGPLMIEHRLIERMIDVVREELKIVEIKNKLDPDFVDRTVDFIRTYADRCHHGKEEDILFRELGGKNLTEKYRHTLEELVEEHRWGRKLTARLVEANSRYREGEKDAISIATDCMKSLVLFYPRHIEKEDKHFFIPCMDYFSLEEQQTLLKEEYEFDRNLIHERYKNIVVAAEKALTSRTL